MNSTLSKALRIIVIVISLGVIITIHEFGHFVACQLFNIKTPTFSIGFGPAVLQKKIGGTIFQVSLLPLGGYVTMNVNDLNKAPYWQKMVITLAGIFNNFLLAFILFFLLFYFNRARIIPIVAYIMHGSPAQHAGFQEGDRIVRIDDQLMENNAASLLHYIQAHPKKEITMIIDRHGTLHEINTRLGIRIMGGGALGYLGIILAKDYSNNLSLFEILKRSKNALSYIMRKSFYFIVTFFKPETREAFSSPIGLTELTSQNLQHGFNLSLFFIATISTELGVFNVMPIPMLDGGQALYYTIEALIGHTLSGQEQNIINLIYLLLIIAFIFYLNRKAQQRK
jgi:regulator of sigma E protease